MLRIHESEDWGSQQWQPRGNSNLICMGKGLVGAMHGLAWSSREGLESVAAAALNADEEL